MGGLNNFPSELMESIYYYPSAKDTGDLEAATKTVTATSEASGLANKDYSYAITLPAPSDSRLTVQRICSRLSVVIDSMTATHAYCRIYVDAQDAEHLLFDKDYTSTGTKLEAVDVLVGTKEAIFNLLKDGSAHTFYFYFWVDAGNAVLSLVKLWECVGTCATGVSVSIIKLDYSGMIDFVAGFDKIGTGTVSMTLYDATNSTVALLGSLTHGQSQIRLTKTGVYVKGLGTVATDMNYFSWCNISLRRYV